MFDKRLFHMVRLVLVSGVLALAFGTLIGQRVSANHVDCYESVDCEIGSSTCSECSSSPAGYCGFQFWGEPFQHFVQEVGHYEGYENWEGYEYQLCYTYRRCKSTGDECPDDERLVQCEEDPGAEFGFVYSPSNLVLWDEC